MLLVISETARYLTAALLLLAGYSKLADRLPHVATVHRLVRSGAARAVGVRLVPWLEAALGAWLIVGWATAAAAVAAALLFMLFMLLLLRARLAGVTALRCYCFGSDHRESRVSLLVLRNVALVAAAGAAAASDATARTAATQALAGLTAAGLLATFSLAAGAMRIRGSLERAARR